MCTTMSEHGEPVNGPLKRGTQIAYVPTHAKGDLSHRDVELGFVDYDRAGAAVACRYWHKNNLPTKRITRSEAYECLRTKANAEMTPRECIIVLTMNLVPFYVIDEAIDQIVLHTAEIL